MNVTHSEFRKALGCFSTGVTVITVDEGGEVHGMTATAFSSVSLDPPLVLVCVGHQARTHAHLQAKKRFGVYVLAADQRAISEYYARASESHKHAEEAGARFDRTSHGTPLLHGALAYLECRLHSAQDAGDHTIFIAEVEDVMVREEGDIGTLAKSCRRWQRENRIIRRTRAGSGIGNGRRRLCGSASIVKSRLRRENRTTT